MPKVPLYDMTGKQTGEIELNDSIFGIEVNETVVHLAVKRQLANQRQGTHSSKTRALVRGGGRKPWKQKGTGRARAGSTRSPIWVGGGVAFGPHPRSHAIKMTRKSRRLALKSALTAKVLAGEFAVLDEIVFNAPKTKDVIKMLVGFQSDALKNLLITSGIDKDADEIVDKSSRNIPGVKAISASGINVIDLLYHDRVFVAKDAVVRIEEVLG